MKINKLLMVMVVSTGLAAGCSATPPAADGDAVAADEEVTREARAGTVCTGTPTRSTGSRMPTRCSRAQIIEGFRDEGVRDGEMMRAPTDAQGGVR